MLVEDTALHHPDTLFIALQRYVAVSRRFGVKRAAERIDRLQQLLNKFFAVHGGVLLQVAFAELLRSSSRRDFSKSSCRSLTSNPTARAPSRMAIQIITRSRHSLGGGSSWCP